MEARRAVMSLVVRAVDEIRFGWRDLDLEELRTLASTWAFLNDGVTRAEIALRHLRDAE